MTKEETNIKIKQLTRINKKYNITILVLLLCMILFAPLALVLSFNSGHILDTSFFVVLFVSILSFILLIGWFIALFTILIKRTKVAREIQMLHNKLIKDDCRDSVGITADELIKIKTLYESGAITLDEYNQKKEQFRNQGKSENK